MEWELRGVNGTTSLSSSISDFWLSERICWISCFCQKFLRNSGSIGSGSEHTRLCHDHSLPKPRYFCCPFWYLGCFTAPCRRLDDSYWGTTSDDTEYFISVVLYRETCYTFYNLQPRISCHFFSKCVYDRSIRLFSHPNGCKVWSCGWSSVLHVKNDYKYTYNHFHKKNNFFL